MALDFYAGCLGGCAGVLVGHPFDTVKVRLQTQDPKKAIYRGTFHCLSTIVKKESFRGLFRGMSSPMAGLAAINAIVFGTYGNVLRATESPNSPSSHFFAGTTAGFIQSIITSPMELAKTRMQLQGQIAENAKTSYWNKPKILYKNPLDCLRKVFLSEGFFGVFRGLWCTILRDAPAFGVYFSCYEYLTQRITDGKGNANTLALLFAGGAAGVISWIVIYPFDVIKSRIQVDGMDGSKNYKGLWDCTKKSYQSEGLRVFTRGLNSTVIRAFPTNAATFAVFTWVFVFFEKNLANRRNVEMTPEQILFEQKMHRIAACIDSCV